ncbi:MAG: lipopolysaccharide biosynthesis protein [Nitrospira sp. CR1.1]|nr:lipopolysaccharide biosynthesis protein [Nitrospira sp. CR1.1]
MAMHEVQHGNLRDFLTVLIKHQNKVIGVFAAAVLTVTAGSFIMTPIYESEATVMVKIGREYMYRPEVGSTGQAISYDQNRIVESEIQIFSSQDVAKGVITKIGLARLYPDIAQDPPTKMTALDAAIEEMRDKLSFSTLKDSNVIKIKFQHPDAEASSRVVNNLLDLVMEKHLKVFSNPQAGFLEKQAADYQEKLELSQSRLQEFKRTHRLSSLQEERQLTLEQRRDLDTALKKYQNQKQGLLSKHTSVKRQLGSIPSQIPLASVAERQGVVDGLKANLLELRLKEQSLSAKFKETSRLITDIRNEINTVEKFLREQEDRLTDRVTTGKNPIYQELEIEILRTESELSSVSTQIAETTQQIRQLDGHLSQLDQLEKELATLQLKVEADQNNYRMYLSKVEEAHVSEKMDELKMANLSIIQAAAVPPKPVKPKKGLNILLGIVAGIIGGISCAFMAAYIEEGYTRPEEAEKDLGIPVLSAVNYKG